MMKTYNDYKQGEQVNIYDNKNFVFAGIITKLGSVHASVTDNVGESFDVPYDMIYKHNTKQAMVKTAQAEIINETEKEGKKFLLIKDETNVDKTLSVTYMVKVDEQVVWESENIITNVYDTENGWSQPDDFDENKLDLIQQSAESGFDMVVDSYDNMINIAEEAITPVVEPGTEGDVAVGEPAFAEDAAEGDMGGGGGGGATMLNDIGGEDVGDTVGEDGSPGDVIDDSLPDSDVGGPESFATEPMEVETSLERTSFSRSIISNKITAKDRLHNNPEHRLNPALRKEMETKNISSDTNDIELAEKLKDFDYSL